MPILIIFCCIFVAEIIPQQQLNFWLCLNLACFNMEVSVYMSLDARSIGKSVFRARVNCPDAFSYDSFVSNMRCIYGEKIVIEFLIV